MPAGGAVSGQADAGDRIVVLGGLGRARVIEIQRARMLAGMAEVCAERGVANVTVTDIVARSGVSRRTFYEQFPDREECMLATLEHAVACAGERVIPAFTEEGRWRERVRAALVALLWFLEDEPSLGRVLVVETFGAGPRALVRRQELLHRLAAAVDEGRSEATPTSGGPPPLTAEGVVGGVLSVLHARLLDASEDRPLIDLASPLTSMVVLPYLGHAVARRELALPAPHREARPSVRPVNPLRDMEMRLTYRTVCVLMALAEHPGSSNRDVGVAAEMDDQGQISKLLSRLSRLGLIENSGVGHAKGGSNAWVLTQKGQEVHSAVTL